MAATTMKHRDLLFSTLRKGLFRPNACSTGHDCASRNLGTTTNTNVHSDLSVIPYDDALGNDRVASDYHTGADYHVVPDGYIRSNRYVSPKHCPLIDIGAISN